jgi:hypothetical protein
MPMSDDVASIRSRIGTDLLLPGRDRPPSSVMVTASWSRGIAVPASGVTLDLEELLELGWFDRHAIPTLPHRVDRGRDAAGAGEPDIGRRRTLGAYTPPRRPHP